MACPPNVAASIGAALSQCQQCGNAPPSRRWLLVDRVSSQRAQPGMTVDVMLDQIPVKDTMGRIGHVRGIYVKATGQFTAEVPAGNDAVSAYQLRSLIDSVFLQDLTGHIYLPSIESRLLVDDTTVRHLSDMQWPAFTAGTQAGANFPAQPTKTVDSGLAADFGEDASAEIGFYFPFVNLNPGADPLAGLVPIAGFQRRSSQGSFRFRLNRSIKAGTGVDYGITFTGVENGDGDPGLDVWFDMVYLPVATSTQWIVDSYTLPENSGLLPHANAATEYAMIRFLPEDAAANAGQALVANLDQFTLSIAGFNELPANMSTLADMTARQFLHYMTEPMGALARFNAKQDLPFLGANGAPAALEIVLYRAVGSGEASGQILYGFAVNPNLQPTRWLQRVQLCQTADHHGALVDASQCSPCGASRLISCGSGGGKPTNKGTLVTPVQGIKG